MIRTFSEWLDARVRQHATLLLTGLAACILILLTLAARTKFLWHDEVYTILESRLTVATLWRASLDGLDLSPPLNTIVTRGVHGLAGIGSVTTRLPAMLGFTSAALLLFAIVQRRSNTLAALSAALLLCS